MILETLPFCDQITHPLMHEVMNTLIQTFGSSTSNELIAACLALLTECVYSPAIVTDLLLGGEKEGSLLLMGLKRILAFKQDPLILFGTQCLTKILENILEPLQTKMILETDLAELIFELLHTSNVQQLDCAFECLQAMANHKLFFEKCHAVYGLESTLTAIRVAMDLKRNTILEKGLSFLTFVLQRQPDNMPIFLNESWWTCASILQDLLQAEYQCIIRTALSTVEAFFRDKHQQHLVDLKVILLIVKSVTSASKNHVQMICQGREENVSSAILNYLFAIVNSMNKLMHSDNALCGNESSSLNSLQQVLKSFCIDSLLPWTIGSWQNFEDEDSVERLFEFLNITIDMTENDEELMQIVPMELLHQGLILLYHPCISKNTQDKGLKILISIFMKYFDTVKPSLQINTEGLLSGFANVQWHEASSLEFFAQNMLNPKERGAVLSFVYLSLLHGYSIADAKSLLQFLKIVADVCPGILSQETYIVRSFVYILAICQANTWESAEDVVFTDSGNDFISVIGLLPVETWYTAGPAVFRWALLTTEKMEVLAKPMVEYWLVHLNHPPSQLDIHFEDLIDQDKAIITTMVPNINFLQCLMGFLHLSQIGTKASSVLNYCIAQLSDVKTWETAPTLLKSLLLSGTKKLDALFIQSADVDCDLASNLLCVLCSLMKSPISGSFQSLPVSGFKLVYNVVKLIGKSWEQDAPMAFALHFFADVVKNLSVQESQTIIPAVLQSEKCTSFIESTFEKPSGKMFSHCLVIVVWLAENGQFYEGKHFVTIRSQFILNYLATCERTCMLLILQLLKFALTAMTEKHTMCGACHFFKGCQAFIPSKIFSQSELRQIYGHLQQYVSQEDSSLRFEAMECIHKLITSGSDLGHFVLQHSWNSTMLEKLSFRIEHGLQDFELDFFLLFSTQSPYPFWSSTSANSFLLALLNSSFTSQQQLKAVAVIKKIKHSQVAVDTYLLETVDACLQHYEDW
ncbi:hypothetical protein RRG08_027661 [Elysia crispata]|uniref:Uncharacterized protein n=1 Tax=Elysia crispata TaxID=231223 RepID=A0AAE0XM54_9GAST|nr:hypothetical protein RRG08_027661 [Elysia crispata]